VAAAGAYTIAVSMIPGPRPAADVVVDAALVQSLLQEQHPDLAHLVPVKAAEGWDNAIFRFARAFPRP
jgi:hypothetical protein